MTLRMCLLVVCAGALLDQAALGCRHHRPSFNEKVAPTYATTLEARPRGLAQAAAGTPGERRPMLRQME
jgi:hypothetical protein